MKQLIVITWSLVLFAFIPNSFAQSSTSKWERLGSKKVNYKIDRDVIKVGAKEGAFTKLKIGVTQGSLNMHKMVVVYKNGQRDEIELRHNFSRLSKSRTIDLPGNKRIIDEIIFWYDTKNKSAQRARIQIFGKH